MQIQSSLSWTLSDWLYFLENRHRTEVKLRLVNPKLVAKYLDVLDWQIPVITVAGTNGKGSTVASLAAIYMANGYNVGSFTSPHLISFNERICINNNQITDKELCNAFHQIENSRNGIEITYFESSLLAALLHFKNANLDLIILEVGVGGRLDATNIIDSDLAIITTIDIDHEEYLGNTREAIGSEKSGIMRTNKPCIFGDYNRPQSIDDYANQIQAHIISLGDDYSFTLEKGNLKLLIKEDKIKFWQSLNLLKMQGECQNYFTLPIPQINSKAASMAIVASVCLSDLLPVTYKNVTDAITSVRLPGRLQMLDREVKILYDVSHNVQSVELLADFIAKNRPSGKIHAVFSGLKDKDIAGLIKPLVGLVNFWYPAVLVSKRASSKDILQEALLQQTESAVSCYESPILAFQQAMKHADAGDLIVIYGSFVLVGAIMESLKYE